MAPNHFTGNHIQLSPAASAILLDEGNDENTKMRSSNIRKTNGDVVDIRKDSSNQPVHILYLIGYALIFVAIFIYAFMGVFYFSNGYRKDLFYTVAGWWGYDPSRPRRKQDKKVHRQEMVTPTYVMLFLILPTFVAGVLFQLTRKKVGTPRGNLGYLTSFLRRKPHVSTSLKTYYLDCSFGELLFLFLIIAGNVTLFVAYIHSRLPSYEERKFVNWDRIPALVGLTFGWNALYTLIFLFFPASRNCFWMDVLNISYAHGIKYHRWLGVAEVLFVVLHCVGYYLSWIRRGIWMEQSLPCFDCALNTKRGHHAWINVFGELSLLCMLIISATSIPYIRRKYYELFYYSHHLFVPAIIFAILHYGNFLWWLYPSITIYMINKIISSSHSNIPTKVLDIRALPKGITRIRLARSTSERGSYLAGQFVYIRIPFLSHLQWHPFSLSSAPSSDDTSFEFYVKDLGEWTKKLHELASHCNISKQLPIIYTDGFYGNRLNVVKDHPTVVFVSGGIGATPVIGMLEELINNFDSTRKIKEAVWFIWSARDLCLFKEFEPLFARAREIDPTEKLFKFRFFLTKEATAEDIAYDASTSKNRTHLSKVITENQLQLEKTILSQNPQPFARSMRSPLSQISLFVVVFGASLALLTYVHYDYRLFYRRDSRLWPLQRLAEAIILILGCCFGYAIAVSENCYERFLKKKTNANEGLADEGDVCYSNADLPVVNAILESGGNFLSDYGVKNGRPIMKDIFQEIHGIEAVAPGSIGVVFSGPRALKDSLELAAIHIKKESFDIHCEEFEF